MVIFLSYLRGWKSIKKIFKIDNDIPQTLNSYIIWVKNESKELIIVKISSRKYENILPLYIQLLVYDICLIWYLLHDCLLNVNILIGRSFFTKVNWYKKDIIYFWGDETFLGSIFLYVSIFYFLKHESVS